MCDDDDVTVLINMNLQVVSLCLSSNTYLKMSSLVSILLREKRRHLFPPVTTPQQLTTLLLSPRLLATGMRMKTIAGHYSEREFLDIVFCFHCLRKEQETLMRQGHITTCMAGDKNRLWTSTGSAI